MSSSWLQRCAICLVLVLGILSALQIFAPSAIHEFQLSVSDITVEIPQIQLEMAARARQRGDLNAARAHLETAAAQSPGRVEVWTALVQVASDSGDIARLEAAIEQATVLGPWEPVTQYRILEAAVRHWTAMDFATRRRVQDTARRGMMSNSQGQVHRVTALLERAGWLPSVCSVLPMHEQYSAFCEFR